jgi:hypothetical protein
VRVVTIAFAFVLLATVGVVTAHAQDGAIVAWGLDDYGQCTPPEPNTDFIAVAAGRWSSQGLKSDGSIVGWSGDCIVPSPNASFVAIAAGEDFSLGLKGDGACCDPTGTCAITTQSECPGPMVWQGAGVPCNPNPCLLTPTMTHDSADNDILRYSVVANCYRGYYFRVAEEVIEAMS